MPTARSSRASARAWRSSPRRGCSTGAAPPRTGRSPTTTGSVIPRSTGSRSSASPRTAACFAAAGSMPRSTSRSTSSKSSAAATSRSAARNRSWCRCRAPTRPASPSCPSAATIPTPLIRRAEDWLHDHFPDDIDLDRLAADLALTPRTFLRRFKAATGETPLVYLQRLRTDAAKRMLEDDRLTIQEVGLAVGYEDVAFFRDLFKRHVGLRPAPIASATGGRCRCRRRRPSVAHLVCSYKIAAARRGGVPPPWCARTRTLLWRNR